MKGNIFVIIVVAALVIIGIRFFGTNKPIDGGNVAASRAMELSFLDYNGKLVSLADFKGQPLVVNTWASWCPFCVKELPDFVAAQEEYGDKVTIIAINRRESLSTARGYTSDLGITNDLKFWLDPDDNFYQVIGGFSMPETVFIDAQGNTHDVKRGVMELPEIRRRIDALLNV